MVIDFDALEKQVAAAFEDRVNNPDAEIIFTNHKRLGYVQVSPMKRLYVDLAVAAGIKMIRIVPAMAKRKCDEMVEGRDDFDDNYRVLVSKALSIPCNTPANYADPMAAQNLIAMLLEAAKSAQTFALYDEKNVVKRQLSYNYKKRPRTRCFCGCNKQLANRRLIVHWRGMLFATMKCCKAYVKAQFPEHYLRIDDEVRFIDPGDLGMPERELALERLTDGEIKYRHPEKVMKLEDLNNDEDKL